jgi:hypothetical protein
MFKAKFVLYACRCLCLLSMPDHPAFSLDPCVHFHDTLVCRHLLIVRAATCCVAPIILNRICHGVPGCLCHACRTCGAACCSGTNVRLHVEGCICCNLDQCVCTCHVHWMRLYSLCMHSARTQCAHKCFSSTYALHSVAALLSPCSRLPGHS